MLNNLSKNLYFLRRKNGLTQESITSSLGLSSSTWSNYENEVSVPSLRDLERIAHYFGVTSGILLEEDLAAANPDSQKFVRGREKESNHLYSVNEKLSFVAEDQPNFLNIWNEVKKLREDIGELKQLLNKNTDG
jgi:transcriptional regulator with XRE-family HTH domain